MKVIKVKDRKGRLNSTIDVSKFHSFLVLPPTTQDGLWSVQVSMLGALGWLIVDAGMEEVLAGLKSMRRAKSLTDTRRGFRPKKELFYTVPEASTPGAFSVIRAGAISSIGYEAASTATTPPKADQWYIYSADSNVSTSFTDLPPDMWKKAYY